jgi:uncharacterized membrane protein YkoI
MTLMRWHRLAAWIGGTQLLVWIASGVAFAWFDFAAVRGTGDKLPPPPLDVARVRLTAAEATARAQAAHAGGAATALALRMVAGAPVYVIELGDAEVAIDAGDGHLLLVDGAQATAIARAGHAAHPPPRGAASEAGAGDDVPLPAWRVPLGDARRTDVYVAARTGEIVAWRTAAYRRFDVLWSLHTLGYVNRDHPSHPAMRVVTALAAAILLTGLLLLFRRVFRRAGRTRRT